MGDFTKEQEAIIEKMSEITEKYIKSLQKASGNDIPLFIIEVERLFEVVVSSFALNRLKDDLKKLDYIDKMMSTARRGIIDSVFGEGGK